MRAIDSQTYPNQSWPRFQIIREHHDVI